MVDVSNIGIIILYLKIEGCIYDVGVYVIEFLNFYICLYFCVIMLYRLFYFLSEWLFGLL